MSDVAKAEIPLDWFFFKIGSQPFLLKTKQPY